MARGRAVLAGNKGATRTYDFWAVPARGYIQGYREDDKPSLD
jgi:hypothetical protein